MESPVVGGALSGPRPELSRSCLNGVLIVSCFCVVVFLLVSFCVRAAASLDISPTLCQTVSDFLTNRHTEGDILRLGGDARSFGPFQFNPSTSRMYAKKTVYDITTFSRG